MIIYAYFQFIFSRPMKGVFLTFPYVDMNKYGV